VHDFEHAFSLITDPLTLKASWHVVTILEAAFF